MFHRDMHAIGPSIAHATTLVRAPFILLKSPFAIAKMTAEMTAVTIVETIVETIDADTTIMIEATSTTRKSTRVTVTMIKNQHGYAKAV